MTKGFKKRWFQVNNRILTYSKSQKEEPRGSIKIDEITSVESKPGTIHDFVSLIKNKKMYSFSIFTPTREFKCLCETESERDKWVKALSTLMKSN